MKPHPDIVEFLARCGVGDTRDAALATMEGFRERLAAANRETNLTRLVTPEDFWTKHVADSLALGLVKPEIADSALSLADVGCGGGFPLVPLAWGFPALKLSGIESRPRKAAFVEGAVAALGLANCRVIARQAREVCGLPGWAGYFDGVVARAVGDAEWLLSEARGLLRPGRGAFLALYKTPASVSDELPAARRVAARSGFAVSVPAAFDLPLGAGRRQFLILTRRA